MANAEIDRLQIQVDYEAQQSSNGVTQLTQALTGLQAIISPSASKLTTFSNNLKKMNVEMANLQMADLQSFNKNIATLSSSLKPLTELGTNKLGSFVKQLKQIPEVSKQLDVATINDFTKKINKLTQAMIPLANQMAKVTAGFSSLPSKVGKASASVSKYLNTTNTSKLASLGTTSKLFNFGALIYGAKALGHAISPLIKESNAYVENLNLFTVAMGESAEQAKQWTETFSNALGLDVSQVQRYMGVFQMLGTGFGLTNEMATHMSKNLTQLTYDISSFYNIPIEESATKLQSALAGELEPVRRLGYALDQATLKQIAFNNGIEKSFTDMTQAEKAQLRYIALLTQNEQVQGDMARTLLTPANALRILGQQFTLLARSVGNIFIPILMKILPVAIAVTKAIRLIADAIASLFGFKLPEIDYSGLEGIGSAVDDVGDSAEKAGKKISKQLGKFDELNNLTTSSGGGGASAGIGSGAFDMELPGYDALESLSKEMEDLTEKILKFFGITKDGFGDLSWSFGDMDTKAKLLVGTIGLLVGWKALGKLATLITAIKGATGTFSFGVLIKGLGTILASVTGLNVVFQGVIAPLGAVVSGTMSLGAYASLAGSALLSFGTVFSVVLAPLTAWVWGLFEGQKEITKFNDSILKFNSTGPMFDKTISNTTKKAVEPFIDTLNELGTTIWGLNLKDIVTDSDVENVKKQTSSIAQALKDNLIVKTVEMEKTLQNTKLFPDVTKRDKYIEAMNASLENEKAMIDFYQSEINAIVENASNEKRAITNAERVQIEEYQRQMGEMGINILSDSEKEAIKIKNQFNKKFFELSQQQVIDSVAQAKELKDKTIEQANDEYAQKLALAEEMRMTLPGFTEEMYNEMVTDAENARDEQIKKANETYSGIVEKVKANYPEVAKIIDFENGKAISAFEAFGVKIKDNFNELNLAIKNIFGKILDKGVEIANKLSGKFNQTLEDIKGFFSKFNVKLKLPHFTWTTTPATGWVKKVLDALSIPASLPKLNVSWYAEGGMPDVGEMFIAREAGPELVGRIGNKNAVANNDQIVEGISQGVYNAMVSAGGNSNTDVTVVLSNKTIRNTFTNSVRSENNRYGRTVVEV